VQVGERDASEGDDVRGDSEMSQTYEFYRI
jgi:hypothetical protein